jgi:phosphate transport system protein
MVDHTVKSFDGEISQLRGLIAEMGGLAEVAIRDSIDALTRRAPSPCALRWRMIFAM